MSNSSTIKPKSISKTFLSEWSELTSKQRLGFFLLSFLGAAFLFSFYFLTLRYSVDLSPDEPFFLSTCERLLKGDRFIIHDWLLPQFVTIFQILPYSVFKKLTGGTEGVILFMRNITAVVVLLNYLFILFRYSKRPWTAVCTAFLFCSFIPLCSFFLGYYLLAPMLLFASASIIIDEEMKLRRFGLTIAGILLSCVVILVPGMAVVWLMYCALVAARFIAKKSKKNTFSDYDFVLDLKTFLFILNGVLISAFAFISLLLIGSGAENILKTIGNLSIHTEYSNFNKTPIVERMQIFKHLMGYEPLPLLMTVESAAILISRKVKKESKTNFKRFLFLLNFLLLLASFIGQLTKLNKSIPMTPPLFTVWFGFNCFLLCEKKKPKMIFLWVLGSVVSLAQDLTSEIACGFGLIISVLPSIVTAFDLSMELKGKQTPTAHAKKSREKKRFLQITNSDVFTGCIFVLSLTVIIACSATNVINYSYVFRELRHEESHSVIKKGPFEGIVVPDRYKNRYDAILSDLDLAMSMTDGPIYVMGTYPFAYLYMDRPITVAATFNALENLNSKYWTVYPDRRPDLVYIPIKEKESSITITEEDFEKMPPTQHVSYDRFEGEAIKGKTGLIVKVKKWKLTAVRN